MSYSVLSSLRESCVTQPHDSRLSKLWLEDAVRFADNLVILRGFPGGSDGKESACNAGLIPGLGRSPGEGNGNPLQYSCR